MRLLSIIVPAYNEQRTITQVLETLVALKLNEGWRKEIIVVDDHSTDNTAAQIQEFAKRHPSVTHHHQPVNKGKGAAVREGIAAATGDFLVFQDADLELNPDEINLLLAKVDAEGAHVVYGSRLMTDASKKAFHPKSYAANVFLTKLSNLCFGIRISDMETCYKLIASDLAKSLELKEERFGFEPEITAKLAKAGATFHEVPISYTSRGKAGGKKIGTLDGVRAIYCILRYGLFR